MYLRVPEGSIWRLPSEQVGGVCDNVSEQARKGFLCL
jgi:hypothetical protein